MPQTGNSAEGDELGGNTGDDVETEVILKVIELELLDGQSLNTTQT